MPACAFCSRRRIQEKCYDAFFASGMDCLGCYSTTRRKNRNMTKQKKKNGTVITVGN